jgi:anti-sigma factor RsiW
MSDDLLKILSESNKDIDNQKLMDYISGKLSAEQKNEVERWMIDNPFFNEAVEGLQHAGGEQQVKASVDEINKALRKYLAVRKRRREMKLLPVNLWTYVAVLLILVLVVVVYLVVHFLREA